MGLEKVFNIEAAQSWIKRYVDTLIYGKYSHRVTCASFADPVFFAKMKTNSAAVFNIKIAGPSMSGSVCLAVSVGEASDLQSASMSVLSTSIHSFFNASSVFLAAGIDGPTSDYIFVGFSAAAAGDFDIDIQAASSQRKGVAAAARNASVAGLPHVSFPVADGYLAGFPVVKPVRELNAFRKWNQTFKYDAEDPVFFAGSAFFANPAAVPGIGESPATNPGKWVQLARPDFSGGLDLTQGAKTPQVFYNPGLIISNTTAVKLRKARQDHGMRYPSENSKVYHFDGDLFDQNQENPLPVIAANTDGTVAPRFISDGSFQENLVTGEPAIPYKPFKETPESFFGAYSVPIDMPVKDGNNCLAFWFKLAQVDGRRVLQLDFASGEEFVFTGDAREPLWNDNAGAAPDAASPDNFPFNSDELFPGSLLYNNRLEFTGLACLQSYEGRSRFVPVVAANLPRPNGWNHIAFNLAADEVTMFLNGHEQVTSRFSNGMKGGAKFVINPDFAPVAIDEMLIDMTCKLSFERFLEVSAARLPWGAHEWKEGWLTVYADDPLRFDSNLALYLYGVGSVITQATVGGVYDDAHLPWVRFHNFDKTQFALQGEVAPSGGSGEKTRFWQRVS